MKKTDILRKLTSRKLWLAVALFVSGIIVAFGGAKETAETVAGCIMQGAAVLGYLLAEGLTDAAAAAAGATSAGMVEALPIIGADVLPGIAVEDLTDDQLRGLLQQMGLSHAYTESLTREQLLDELDKLADAAE